MSVIDFGRPVGSAHPPFIIASLDARELGTLGHALAAVDAAADSSCDSIKISRMPWAWGSRLFAAAEARGLVMLAPALDEDAVARLDWLGAPAFYLVYDWSDLELVARAARTGKPLVMQVGTASQVEIAEVIETARANGSGGIALVQSVIDVDLEGLDTLSRHKTVVGISDRSRGAAIPLAAISRGACIVEKRFTRRTDDTAPASVGSVDGTAPGFGGAPGRALVPAVELAEVVRDCEQAWAALGLDRRWSVN